MQRMIVQRFRTLRLKEVDTVYDAFYLVHQHAENCLVCSGHATSSLPEQFIEREKLLREAFSLSQDSENVLTPISLDLLVSLMRQRSQGKRFLSSIYFAGAEGDHPYFLKNDKFALGISVLPEDAPKAGISKCHPHQQEAIFVLNGTLCLEIKDSGKAVEKVLKGGDVYVIKKGQCHVYCQYIIEKQHTCL